MAMRITYVQKLIIDKIPFYVLRYVSIILYLHYVEEELCRNSKLALSKEEEAFIANSLFHETNVRSTLMINAIKVFPAYYKKVMASELTNLIGKMKDENGENWSNFLQCGEKSLKQGRLSIGAKHADNAL